MDTNTEKKNSSKVRQHYSHDKADARRDKRRQEAEARQRAYDALSIKDRIALAKSRPGSSKREITRLEALLNKPAPKAAVVASVPVATTEDKPKRTPKSKVVAAAKAERPSKS